MPERTLRPYPYTPAPQLVADTGGTNTRVALADSGVLRQGSIRRYRNAGHGGLPDILRDYLNATATTECDGVCVAVAGPVREGRADLTNLDWTITEGDLADLGGTRRVVLLNDLQAQGHALSSLPRNHLNTLLPGQPATAGATQMVVGAGTGFNAAPVHHPPSGAYVAASECGHIHLPTQDDDEQALARHLAQRHGVATVEEALSGRGLIALHRWTSGQEIDAETLMARMADGEAGARETGRLYARLMGRVLADLALVHLPFGGIYLIGGVARAMAPHLTALGMGDAFRSMGRYAPLMESFAIHVVEDDYAALHGCARCLTALPR